LDRPEGAQAANGIGQMGFGPARPTDLENPERTFEQQKPQDKEEMVDSLEDIRLTLGQRGTELPGEIVAFSQKFIAAKQIQWIAFRNMTAILEQHRKRSGSHLKLSILTYQLNLRIVASH